MVPTTVMPHHLLLKKRCFMTIMLASSLMVFVLPAPSAWSQEQPSEKKQETDTSKPATEHSLPALRPAAQDPGNPVKQPTVEPAQAGATSPNNQQNPIQQGQQRGRLNPERLVIQAMMRLLVKQGIFPEHVYELYRDGQNPVVNKAHFADVMVKALGHDTSIVSEFPVYRDVDKSHWAYAPIEVLRERQLMGATPQGYFYPDAPITRQQAYLIIARTVAGKDPSLELANEILSPFSDVNDIPPKIRPAIARLVNAKIIIPRPAPRNQLNLSRKMRYGELAAILSREIEIKDYRRLLLPVDKKTLPQLPGGLALSIVPNGAIYKNALAVGDTIYFSLTEPINTTVNGKSITIPRGSRLDGALTAIHQQFYTITFETVQTPEGNRYRIHTGLSLEFNTKPAEPFIVPGTPYQVTSSTP